MSAKVPNRSSVNFDLYVKVSYKLIIVFPVSMATKLYKLSSDQVGLNSFKHLSKQSIHINTFFVNTFSKVATPINPLDSRQHKFSVLYRFIKNKCVATYVTLCKTW